MKRFLFVFSLMISLPLWAQIEPDRVFPRLLTHIPKFEQGFKATILLKNEAKLAKEIYFNCFNESGEVINLGDPFRFRIEPGETMILDGSDVLPEGTTHVTIHGSTRVRVSVMYGAEGNESGSNALLHETSIGGHKFLIYPTGGNPTQGYWEGLALINLASEPNGVDFYLKDATGNIIAQSEFTVQPMAKMVSTLDALFTDSFSSSGFQIEVESKKPVNIIMLSGNADRKDFTNVYPEPLSSLEPLLISENLEDLPKSIISFDGFEFIEELFTISTILPNPCHDLELYWIGAFKESEPLQVDLYVVARDNSDICFQPLIKKTRSFDLTSLIQAFADTGGTKGDKLIVNLRDKDHREILYVYEFYPFQ